MPELKFEKESYDALKIMENTNECVYLTWKAGAWKSTLVNYFISKTKKKYILLWTTGISAINIWGQTIHSFFNLVPNVKTFMKSETIEAIKETDIFIIDEVSMARADLIDTMNKKLQYVMKNEEFMGWKQFIFVWDLYQLPPVWERQWMDKDKTVRNELYDEYHKKYKWLFFFHAMCFLQNEIKIVELKKVYRQSDPIFINMLNRLRVWDSSYDIVKYFNQKVVKSENDVSEKAILIATTNAIVDTKNTKELNALPGQVQMSKWIVSGHFPQDMYPTDLYLRFKEWARVMFTVNDNKTFLYVNGTLWTVVKFESNGRWFITKVKIQLDDGWEITVEKKTWSNIDGVDAMGEPNIIWNFTQFPFKLAFAITIHKVQGKSFDNVVIDLWWWAFAEWQTYVALSRCRSYDWLQLIKPIKQKDIQVSNDVIRFLKN